MLEQLKTESIEADVSMAELIRKAVELYFESKNSNVAIRGKNGVK
jgi:hypothetical protein